MLCLGLALTDAETNEFLLEHDSFGRFNYIDRPTANRFLSARLDFRCGGSSANTAKAFAGAGMPCSFYGAVGRDGRGQEFAQDLSSSGVCASLDFHDDSITGFAVLVTKPERRAFFHYGAAEKIDPASISEFSSAIHTESYIFSLDCAAAIDEKYRKQKTPLRSLSLSGIASSCRTVALRWIRPLVLDGCCDIIVGNDREFMLLFDCDERQYIRSATECCRYAAITKGGRGSVVASGNEVHEVPAYMPHDVQVTGVLGDGDAYAGGFLAGITGGCGLRDSGFMGAYSAFEKIKSSSGL